MDSKWLLLTEGHNTLCLKFQVFDREKSDRYWNRGGGKLRFIEQPFNHPYNQPLEHLKIVNDNNEEQDFVTFVCDDLQFKRYRIVEKLFYRGFPVTIYAYSIPDDDSECSRIVAGIIAKGVIYD